MIKETRIGIVGFGEAGIAIATEHHEGAGLETVGFDTRLDTSAVLSRAASAGVRVVEDIGEHG